MHSFLKTKKLISVGGWGHNMYETDGEGSEIFAKKNKGGRLFGVGEYSVIRFIKGISCHCHFLVVISETTMGR